MPDSVYQQLKAERDELDEECNHLHEKNGDLNLEVEKLQEELQQAREEIKNLTQRQATNQSTSKDIEKKEALIHQLGKEIYELQCKLYQAKKQAEVQEGDHKVQLEGLRRKIGKPVTNALPNLEEIRDRILKDTRSDKLKAVSAALERFIAELKPISL